MQQRWSDDSAWRGDMHPEIHDDFEEEVVEEDDNWPEHLAGPEYRMWRDILEDEEE